MGNDKHERKYTDKRRSVLDPESRDDGKGGWKWSDVPPSSIADIIRLVTERGGAIRFGYSRDGGAGAVGVYYGDARDTIYIRGSDDFDMAAERITRAFEKLPGANGRSPDA